MFAVKRLTPVFLFLLGYLHSYAQPAITSFTPVTGTVYDLITIKGVNFTGVTGVSFGGVAAYLFTVVDSVTITAVPGTGASGRVTVTAGKDTSSMPGFTYHTQPVISYINPTSGGKGTSIFIAGVNFSGATAVTIGGTPAASFQASSPYEMRAIVDTGSSGVIRVTTPKGTDTMGYFTYTGPSLTSFSPVKAGTGDTVTIKGNNLNSTLYVLFGKVQAPWFKVVNTNTVLAVVGSGASGDVSVTTIPGTATLPGFLHMTPQVLDFSPAYGDPGTTITLKGKNFTGVTTVRFEDSLAASFAIANDTTLTAVMARGSTGTIRVTSAYGTGTRKGFTYTGPPVMSGFSPKSAGPGTTILITGAQFDSTIGVTFGGKPALSYKIISKDSIRAITDTGASGNVSVITRYGSVSQTGFTYRPAPRIDSFAPLSGPAGTPVTITGQRFSAVASQNEVYFGAVKATVTAATANTLTVLAPAETSFQPITVVTNGLTAYAKLPFTITFPHFGNTSFGKSSFSIDQKINLQYFPRNARIADFDGDGKPDIAVINTGSLGFSVIQNTGAAGTLSFKTPQTIVTGRQEGLLWVKDFNGDGKPDVFLTFSNNGAEALLLINTSQGGMISFTAPYKIITPFGPSSCSVADIDLDGRPDIVTADRYQNRISVIRNGCTPGIISFTEYIDIDNTIYSPGEISCADLDNDGKVDVAVAGPDGQLFVYRNKSTLAKIAFDIPVKVPFATNLGLAIGDLNGDNKADIVAGEDYTNSRIMILKNTSTPGALSFARTIFAANTFTHGIALADVNGDGKPEMVVDDNPFVKLFNNTSTADSISFEPHFAYLGSGSGIAVGDMDGDGQPDIVSPNEYAMAVFRNRVGAIGIQSFTPTTGKAGDKIFITGQGFTDVQSVTFGGTPAASFQVDSATHITATLAQGASGNVTVTTANGKAAVGRFTYLYPPPVVTSFTPAAAATGTTVTIIGKNFTDATSVRFGNVAAASFKARSGDTITAVVAAGASGYITIITPTGIDSLTGFTYRPPAPRVTSFTPTRARTGDTIIITGSYFDSTVKVTLGTIAAASFRQRGDTIKAVVANGASGFVTVTTLYGTDSLPGLTYIPPAPRLISFMPTSARTGDTIIITGSYLNNTSTVSFGKVAAASFRQQGDTIKAVVANGASGFVTITTPSGADSLPGFTYLQPVHLPALMSFTPASGYTGDTIVITGNYLDSTFKVTFGKVAATKFLLQGNTIKAIIANGASGYVTITTPSGSDSLPGFTYKEHPIVPIDTAVTQLGLRPNPAHGILYIKHPAGSSNARIEIFSSSGKMVKQLTPAKDAVQTETHVDGLPAGQYIILWRDGNAKKTTILLII